MSTFWNTILKRYTLCNNITFWNAGLGRLGLGTLILAHGCDVITNVKHHGNWLVVISLQQLAACDNLSLYTHDLSFYSYNLSKTPLVIGLLQNVAIHLSP